MLYPDSNIFPFAIAFLLSVQGYLKHSVSLGGACAAFCVGFAFFACPLHSFGTSLLVFYFLGSRVTKIGKQTKVRLEDGYNESACRSGSQVFCNSFAGLVACLVWGALFVPGSLLSPFVKQFIVVERHPYDRDLWCPLSREISGGWSRWLLLASLGHFACCLGDTFASELGILSHSPPILITTFRRVPPGTNGGMSLGGTLASLAGGFVIGCTFAASLIVENSKCREQWADIFISLSLWGTLAGGLGSLIDSLLGATVQKSRYSRESKRILKENATLSPSTEDVGGIDILTNNQVNLVSSTLTAILLGLFA